KRDESGENEHWVLDAFCWALSADGRLLASAHHHHRLIVWEALTGKPIRAWQAHQGDMRKLLFSPDGRRLLSVNEDGTALLWDLTGRLWGDPRPKELRQAWEDLTAEDAAQAHRAVWALAEAGGRGAAFL